MKRLILRISVLFILFQGIYFPQSPVIQSILNQTNTDSLMHFTKELSGVIPTIINGTPQTIVSRHKNQPGNALAETYIKQKLESYGLQTTIQSFSSTGKNVYAVQPGTEFPNRKYIICAHFDCMPSGSLAPGADDNASGTAAVIEAARLFTQYSFPYTIIYALWDEEEQGLIGSAYYANQAALAGDSILGVINMDMIAYDGNNDGVVNIHTRPIANSIELSDKMVEVNTTYSIGLNPVLKNPGISASDHASFWNKGYGAILLIEDDTNDFNPYYHTVNDVIAHFNIPYFTKSAKLALATLASFALNLKLTIEHTPFASVDHTNDLILNAMIITGLDIGTGVAAPRLYYRVNHGGGYTQFYEVVGVPTEVSGSYNFTIPGQPLGTTVQYYLAAQDANSTISVTLPAGGSGFNPPGSTPPSTLFRFFVAPIEVLMADDATNTLNWNVTGQWGTTTLKFTSPPSSFTESPSGNYGNNWNYTFTYALPIQLDSLIGATLEFSTQWDIENNWDYGQVLISTNLGTTWIPMAGLYTNPGTGSFQPPGQPLYDGTQLTWVNEIMDLTPYVGQTISLRFLFRSDGVITADGWYIDDIVIRGYKVIPVELVSFAANLVNNHVLIEWSTATETNNMGFEVQRSADKSEWLTIAFKEGQGTTVSLSHYAYMDLNPYSGISYYRLKQVDYDGSFRIYEPVEVDLSVPSVFALKQNYPNPFNPSTRINFNLAVASDVTLKIFDVLGQEIVTVVNGKLSAGTHTAEVFANQLTSGVYFYRLDASGVDGSKFSQVKKMLLSK